MDSFFRVWNRKDEAIILIISYDSRTTYFERIIYSFSICNFVSATFSNITFVNLNRFQPPSMLTQASPHRFILERIEGNTVHEHVRSGASLSTSKTDAQILSVGGRANIHITLVVSGRSIARAVRNYSVDDFVRTHESLERARVAVKQSVGVEGHVVCSSVR